MAGTSDATRRALRALKAGGGRGDRLEAAKALRTQARKVAKRPKLRRDFARAVLPGCAAEVIKAEKNPAEDQDRTVVMIETIGLGRRDALPQAEILSAVYGTHLERQAGEKVPAAISRVMGQIHDDARSELHGALRKAGSSVQRRGEVIASLKCFLVFWGRRSPDRSRFDDCLNDLVHAVRHDKSAELVVRAIDALRGIDHSPFWRRDRKLRTRIVNLLLSLQTDMRTAHYRRREQAVSEVAFSVLGRLTFRMVEDIDVLVTGYKRDSAPFRKIEQRRTFFEYIRLIARKYGDELKADTARRKLARALLTLSRIRERESDPSVRGQVRRAERACHRQWHSLKSAGQASPGLA